MSRTFTLRLTNTARLLVTSRIIIVRRRSTFGLSLRFVCRNRPSSWLVELLRIVTRHVEEHVANPV